MKEQQQIEWKESWRDDALRTICGFANADGGVLVIGRNDHGHVAGIDNGSRLLDELPNKIRDLLGIMVDVNLCSEAGHDYIEITVPAYPARSATEVEQVAVTPSHFGRPGLFSR